MVLPACKFSSKTEIERIVLSKRTDIFVYASVLLVILVFCFYFIPFIVTEFIPYLFFFIFIL